MKTLRFDKRVIVAVAAAALTAWWAAPVSAQLDPLLFVKRVPPTVVVVVDTSLRMLEDGTGHFYDPMTYSVADDPPVSTALGLDPLTQTLYRRRFRNLLYENVQDASTKFEAEDIVVVPDTAPDFATFYDVTRLEIAKRGIAQAVAENVSVRWALVKMRQSAPAWRVSPNCDKPVRITANAALALISDSAPCNAGAAGKFGAYVPTVAAPNYSLVAAPAGTVVAQAGVAGSVTTIINKVTYPLNDTRGLIPAAAGSRLYDDRPVTYLLTDAKAEVIRAMGADPAATRAYRNTVVVLITGGVNSGDPAYMAANDVLARASEFTAVSSGGVTKRAPVFVIGVRPNPGDEVELRAIANNSGGAYFAAAGPTAIARVLNAAVQYGFARSSEFDAGVSSEYTAVSPIVGTVNLKGATDVSGNPLPLTEIFRPQPPPNNTKVPQRSNVILTSGFALPGFEARIRAFRTFKPVEDATKPSGYKFIADGTRLWPDLDGRPELAGLARTPADPNSRNIFTAIPNGAGPGDVIAFTPANAAQLAPHVRLSEEDTTTLIDALRAVRIGAVIGSTPAMMDAPSLDPPPDDDYGRAGAVGTFAGDYEQRRTIIFVGANDGMIHAFDALTGYEVWAFIPYNLLPKLKTQLDGQPVEQFDYFVDSSPKIAEVKVLMTDGSHKWRSMLIIGQGPGGTFYQAFDVTEAGMGVAQDAGGIAAVNSLLQRFDSPNESIEFKWAFPRYDSFDPTYFATLSVTDATPGKRLRMFGDLKPAASDVEKSVGFTWSDPAVGPLNADRTLNAVIVGSGYFPAIEDVLPGRGPGAPRAGRSFYLIDVRDGHVIGNPGSCSGTGCLDVGDIGGAAMKNALQADPSAAGNYGSPVVSHAYLGDLNGKYWRFDFDESGSINKTQMISTDQPIFSSSALLFVGSTNVYMFFSTGSDLLPTSSPHGTGRFKLWGLQDDFPAAGATTKFSYELANVTDVGGIATGERPSTAPSVAGDIVFYTTTTEDAAAPGANSTANLYAFTYLGGAAYDSASSNNNKLDRNESPLVRSVAGRATAPFIVDQHLFFASAALGGGGGAAGGGGGVTIEVFGDPEDFNNGVGQVGVRLLSWREIR